MEQSGTRRLGTTAWVRKRERSEGVGQEKQSEEIEERALSVRLLNADPDPGTKPMHIRIMVRLCRHKS
jgi:hypothetical protein